MRTVGFDRSALPRGRLIRRIAKIFVEQAVQQLALDRVEIRGPYAEGLLMAFLFSRPGKDSAIDLCRHNGFCQLIIV